MRNISLLIYANMRKNKSQTASLFAFVLLAAMFMELGITIMFGLNAFFDKRAKETNAEHFIAIYAGSGVTEQTDYIGNYAGVTDISVTESVGGLGNYLLNGAKNIAYMYFVHADKTPPPLIGEAEALTGDGIYIPYFMALNGGYKIGDRFAVDLAGAQANFTVTGVTEEIVFGAQTTSLHRFYVSDEKYAEMKREFPVYSIIAAHLENSDDAVFLEADFDKNVTQVGQAFTYTLPTGAKPSRTTVTVIASVIISAFAVILLIVSLIVIRFRIVNSIEESMTNIGALKAVGYLNRQIVASTVGQFSVIAFAGGICGIALSYASAPLIADALRPMYALDWKPSFDFATALIPLLSATAAITLTSFLSALPITKLHPLIALRGGITAHNFKKNPFPLDKSRGSLGLLLAAKQLLQNKKQTATISVIVAAVTAAAVCGLAVNYNMNEKRDNFARSLMGEIPEANFVLKEGRDGEAFRRRTEARSEVRKVFAFFSPKNILVNDVNIMAAVADDFSQMESGMLYKGRFPKHNNEIALGPAVLKVLGKEIGDSVYIGGKEFIVTGIVQFMNNNGFNGAITESGVRESEPEYVLNAYNVYLESRDDVAGFIEKVKADEGDIFENIMNTDDQMNSMFGMMGNVFAAVALGIVAVTAFVVVMTLYMVIKTAILRRTKQLGIQKAIGFTTLQLMNQIALGMTPAIIIGAVAGALIGYFGFNPMMTAMLSGMGFAKVNLPAPLGQTALVCASLIALAYAVSMAIALRIRRISAYALVSE